MSAELLLARDGLPARPSGPWVVDKLGPLARQLNIFARAMRDKFPGGTRFVDLMAGPGICIDTRSPGQPEFRGSTLLALDTEESFHTIIAVEADPRLADALKQRKDQHRRAHTCFVIPGDCNEPAIVDKVRTMTDRALTLMFVDLIGTEVTMETIRRLTKDRSVDLCITWPEMDAIRNQGLMGAQPERWTAFFGTDEWQAIARERPRRLKRLRDLYMRQLQALDYQHTALLQGVKNRVGRTIYRPLFASRHPLGLEFRQKAEPPQSQGGLFDE
jgi:three-Cys-motif partner protein